MCLVQHIASCSTLITGWMPTIFRAGRGMTLWEKARPDPPSKKLELFSYENNPVRNKICFSYNNFTFHMIGLPHIYRFSMHEVIVQDTTSTCFSPVLILSPMPCIIISAFFLYIIPSMHELCVRHYVNWSFLTSFRMWEMGLPEHSCLSI